MKNFTKLLIIALAINAVSCNPVQKKSEIKAETTTAVDGVTNIVMFINETDDAQIVYKFQDKVEIVIPAHSQTVKDMWISHAVNRAEFNANKIMIYASSADPTKYYIWQRNVDGDDRVRSTTRTTANDDGWEDPGPRINGVSEIYNTRNLRITKNGISLEYP